MELKISKGNMKVPFANISTTPIKTCINCKECSKKCYALKAYRQYPSTRKAWDNNADMMKNQLGDVYYDLIKFLDTYKKKYFRFNVAGDILNDIQFSVYKQIARDYPHIQFLSFTKNYELDFNLITENYSVVLSTWEGMPLPKNNTLPRAYISTDKRISNKALKCAGSCKECQVCWNLKSLNADISFNIH